MERKLSKNGFPPQTERCGLVVFVREMSLLFFDDGKGKEVFLPVRTIMDRWYTIGGTKREFRLIDLELDDEIGVGIPCWLLASFVLARKRDMKDTLSIGKLTHFYSKRLSLSQTVISPLKTL